MLHLLLSSQFRRNDRNLCHHCLAHPVFSVTMFASTVSRRGNRHAQIYATDFGWARTFTMASISEAHEIMLLLFDWDGVPLACILEDAKNLDQGKYYHNLKDAACHLKLLAPYTPWSIAKEKEIEKLKKGAGHKLLETRAPRV